MHFKLKLTVNIVLIIAPFWVLRLLKKGGPFLEKTKARTVETIFNSQLLDVKRCDTIRQYAGLYTVQVAKYHSNVM